MMLYTFLLFFVKSFFLSNTLFQYLIIISNRSQAFLAGAVYDIVINDFVWIWVDEEGWVSWNTCDFKILEFFFSNL